MISKGWMESTLHHPGGRDSELFSILLKILLNKAIKIKW